MKKGIRYEVTEDISIDAIRVAELLGDYTLPKGTILIGEGYTGPRGNTGFTLELEGVKTLNNYSINGLFYVHPTRLVDTIKEIT